MGLRPRVLITKESLNKKFKYATIICMRIYLDHDRLGSHLAQLFKAKDLSQATIARGVSATQGEISKILNGNFRTQNSLVTKLCKYAAIDIASFHKAVVKKSAGSEAMLALSLACKGEASREKAVVRILRAIHDLA
jgi:transcriptional regulator with XRE-family HTH domain